MRMDSRIILAGQTPDFLGTIGRANEMAARQNEFDRQNALAQLYEQHGAGIAAGNQESLNALAATDPMAALNVQKQHLGMDATRQGMQINAQELELRKQDAARKAQQWAMGVSAQEAAAKSERIKAGLMSAGAAFQAGNLGEVNRILTSVGEQPLQSLDQFPYIAAQYEGVLSALEGASKFGQPEAPDYGIIGNQFFDKNNPAAGAQNIPGVDQKPADEYERYAAEQRDLGQEPLSRIDYAQAKRGKGTVVYDPQTGKPLVSIGGGVDPTDVTSPSSPAAMIASIEGILNDPALDTSTGMLSALQRVPGTPQRRFGARAKQLEGQAFLQAFESLKGGGHITEIEGQKATDAIGRLDTAQSADDYRAALTELRDTLKLGLDRQQRGEVVTGQQQPAEPVVVDGYTIQRVD